VVSLFKDRSPATIIWLFILSIIVHSHFFVYFPTIHTTESNGPLSIFINKYLVLLSPAFIVFTYHALVILQSLRLNHLFTDHRMFSRVTYLPAMVYILLTGLFTEWSSLTPALIGNTFVIWLFAKIAHLNNSPDPKTLLFNIGLLISVSALLYQPMALLLPAAFFALMILRPFIITQWLVLLLGVIAPFYFLVCFLYLKDALASIKNYVPVWKLNLPQVHVSIVFFITIAIIIFILLAGLYYWQQENRRLLIQIRNNWVVLLVMLLVMLPLPFINKNAGIESLILCIVPATPIISRGFFAPKKNTLPALMFWALLIVGILKNWLIVK
jgi:hypothetical protein